MSAIIESLKTIAAPWAALYSDHTWISVLVVATHLGAMLVGGGIAVGADRKLLESETRYTREFSLRIEDVEGTHTWVVRALIVAILSGVLMTLADVETFLVSPVYWVKMLLVVALLANGRRMQLADRQLLASVNVRGEQHPPINVLKALGTLRTTAILSLIGWFATLFLGVVLTNS